MSDTSFIPLLSGKTLEEMTPEEFKRHVHSLYWRKPKKKTTPKKKKLKDYKITARILKNGTISIKTKRDPKYVTEEEYGEICEKLSSERSTVFIALKAGGIIVCTHAEAEHIKRDIDAIPF